MTVKDISQLLKNVYVMLALPDKEFAKYCLICRYEDKVSKRLRNEKRLLEAKAKKLSQVSFEKLIYRNNPLFALIPKEEKLIGTTYEIPFKGAA